ncbi:Hypothetical protein SMAX5B_013696 [Scophthalmus maximus]|uniref:Uncharacterized protein n=1 Tax=Scophthalmus maximus TaxID=52904 RepID=A0A2U9AZR9_SCOMX|nr:Hypothetical protein SMAX5B_013696 [Scophthalmus maximus]
MGGDSSHYLEQVVEYGHLQPGQTKVSAIKQYPVPTTKKTVPGTDCLLKLPMQVGSRPNP